MLVQNLSGFRYQQGNFEAAVRDLREVVGIWRRTLGAEDGRTLWSMEKLGINLREQGRYDEAEAILREVLAGRRKHLGDSHPDVARTLRNIAILKRRTGELNEAERLLREALAIARASPEGRDVTARVLGELGFLLREALDTNTRLLGTGHPETSATRRDLGYSLALQGRYAEAEQLLLQAYRDLGKQSDYWSGKEKRETLRRLVELYRKQGRPAEVAKYRRLLERLR
jgi:tetratricopeptide (TPR) repeat protein